jgi:hypothetical protein
MKHVPGALINFSIQCTNRDVVMWVRREIRMNRLCRKYSMKDGLRLLKQPNYSSVKNLTEWGSESLNHTASDISQ